MFKKLILLLTALASLAIVAQADEWTNWEQTSLTNGGGIVYWRDRVVPEPDGAGGRNAVFKIEFKNPTKHLVEVPLHFICTTTGRVSDEGTLTVPPGQTKGASHREYHVSQAIGGHWAW
jgi:hypothetical protein